MSLPDRGFDLLNYTPHALHLGTITFESKGNIRLKNVPSPPVATWKNAIPIVAAPTYDGFDALPEEISTNKRARGILVSLPVGEYVRAHPDALPGYFIVLGPDTSPANVVRNEGGQIVGSKAMVLYREFM